MHSFRSLPSLFHFDDCVCTHEQLSSSHSLHNTYLSTSLCVVCDVFASGEFTLMSGACMNTKARTLKAHSVTHSFTYLLAYNLWGAQVSMHVFAIQPDNPLPKNTHTPVTTTAETTTAAHNEIESQWRRCRLLRAAAAERSISEVELKTCLASCWKPLTSLLKLSILNVPISPFLSVSLTRSLACKRPRRSFELCNHSWLDYWVIDLKFFWRRKRVKRPKTKPFFRSLSLIHIMLRKMDSIPQCPFLMSHFNYQFPLSRFLASLSLSLQIVYWQKLAETSYPVYLQRTHSHPVTLTSIRTKNFIVHAHDCV